MALSDASRATWRLAARPAFLIFLITRVWLVVGYTSMGSDVAWAYLPVVQGAARGAMPYRDVPFPYPPLALLAVLIPAVVRTDMSGYHLAFQAEMVALDVVCFLLVVWFLETRLRLSVGRVRLGMLVYAGLGFALGNIIYDRLDLMIALTFIAIVCLHHSERAPAASYYGTLALGTLAKIVPLFWLPAGAIQALGATPARSRLRWLATAVVAFALPIAAVMLVGNVLTKGGLFHALGEHAERGIEIESIWATPFVLARATGLAPSLSATVEFGSVNLTGAGLPGWVVFLSQYAGFTLLAVLVVAALWKAWQHPTPLSDDRHLRMVFGITLLLIATQRVFSPQYLIWLIPGFAVLVAGSDRPVALVSMACALYGLTYAIYPFGFDALVNFRLPAALALTGRNGLVVVLAAWCARDVIQSFRMGLKA